MNKRGKMKTELNNSSDMEHYNNNIEEIQHLQFAQKIEQAFLKFDLMQNNTSLTLSVLNVNLDKLILHSLFINLPRVFSRKGIFQK